MSIFGKVVDFLSAGIGKTIVDTVSGQFPAKLTAKEKSDIEAAIMEATRQHELELLTIAKEEDAEFNRRIKDMEGTAKDLQQFGFFGRLIVFLRGAQRPIWGYGVLVLDFLVFSKAWRLPDSESGSFSLESAFWVINFLVLGFLFGERAMRNVLPIIENMRSSRQPSGNQNDSANKP